MLISAHPSTPVMPPHASAAASERQPTVTGEPVYKSELDFDWERYSATTRPPGDHGKLR